MDVDDYQKQAMKTCKPDVRNNQLYSACSMVEEAGEFMRIVRKEIFHGKVAEPGDKLDELGDLAWTLAHACDALGVPLSLVLQRNLDKLAARHGSQYKDSHYTAKMPTNK